MDARSIALVIVSLIPGVISYGIFRPYADTLPEKVILNAIAFPVLIAMIAPMILGNGPDMIPVYLATWSAYFAIVTVVLHFAERALGEGD